MLKEIEQASFDDYVGHIEEQSRFFKESGQYTMRGKGDTDMWKLFLERMIGFGVDPSF